MENKNDRIMADKDTERTDPESLRKQLDRVRAQLMAIERDAHAYRVLVGHDWLQSVAEEQLGLADTNTEEAFKRVLDDYLAPQIERAMTDRPRGQLMEILLQRLAEAEATPATKYNGRPGNSDCPLWDYE